MLELTPTKDPPALPGYYWCKPIGEVGKPPLTWRVVEARIDGRSGQLVPVGIGTFKVFSLFAGPLQPPAEPAEPPVTAR